MPDPETAQPPFIPLCVPEIRGNEWKYVKECLDTAWVSSVGAFVERLEQDVAQATGAEHAVATVNGTAALHTALLVAGVQPDDEVLVSTLTFIASANAVRYANAWPVFIDAEPNHWQLDPNLVADFLRDECTASNGGLVNRRTGRRIAAILPVHVLGHAVEMDSILDLARRYGLRVVEDAAESLGTNYQGKPVGALGDAGCVSFNGNKLLTAGGGGMVVTNDAGLAERARFLTTQAKPDPVEYAHPEIGFNYRLTNLQAAVGCAQMEKLDEYADAKRRIAATYRRELADIPGLTHFEAANDADCTYWMYTVQIDGERFGVDSRELCRRLGEMRIQTRPLWEPMHQSRAHHGAQAVLSGTADRLYQRCLSLPCSVGISDQCLARVCDSVRALQASSGVRGAA